MQGCVISCGTVVFFQKSRNLLRSLLSNNNVYCGILHARPSFLASFDELDMFTNELKFDITCRLPTLQNAK